MELQDHAQCEFACDKLGPSQRKRNSFVLTAGVGEERSVLWAQKVLLPFCTIYPTDGGGTEYVFLQYIECKMSPDEVDKEWGCRCMKLSTTDREDQSAVSGEDLSNLTEVTVGIWLRAQPFNAICGVAHVLRGNKGLHL